MITKGIKKFAWQKSSLIAWSLFINFNFRAFYSPAALVPKKIADQLLSVARISSWFLEHLPKDHFTPFWSHPQTFLQAIRKWLPLAIVGRPFGMAAVYQPDRHPGRELGWSATITNLCLDGRLARSLRIDPFTMRQPEYMVWYTVPEVHTYPLSL